MTPNSTTSPQSRKRELLAAGSSQKSDAEWLDVQVESPPSDDSVETNGLLSAGDSGPKPNKPSKPRPTQPTPFARPLRMNAQHKVDLEFAETTLRCMAVCSAVTLLGVFMSSIQWETLMSTSGFVDYSLTTWITQLPLLPLVAAIVMWMVSEFGTDLRVLGHSPRLLHAYTMAFRVVGYGILLGVLGVFACTRGIPQQTMMHLATQTDAVTAFNKGYCRAWCRNEEEGLDAFMRGDCGPNESTVFDALLQTIDVKGWCKQAIAKQNYELVAEYYGVAPFAGLKTQGAYSTLLGHVAYTKVTLIAVILSSMFNAFVGALVAFLG